ncbi:Ldh family oxidoreductase [Falsiroseomonas oryziterrae]|uniref:Ldh family oxidoreductase n=1 Tax=Falsiroseomonas oryziterrae TaxID=2911368 RepID=UPI001F20C5A3|nr:Ldh family oxidoreductase [Roseomonas sp. NPKOSM-4]
MAIEESVAASLPRIRHAAMIAFIADVLRAHGLREADARRVGELMVEADLTGADSHGIFRLPQYVRRLRAKGMNPTPEIRLDRRAPAVAIVEGDNGMGHLVMSKAGEAAVEIARETGVAWVGARRSNHAGSGAVYACLPLAAGMVGIYTVVASANHMAPWGGSDSLLGTNPLAIAIPMVDADPVVLDMATTVVSYGTVKGHALLGTPMPEGWMVDVRTGEPLTDPARSKEGILLPIGGYKGSGLAMMLGLLAGPLNRAAFGRDVVDFNADDRTVTETGHALIALDVSRFLDPRDFTREVARHLDDLRNSTKLPGVDRIRLPGEMRASRRRDRVAKGVPIPDALMRQLDKLADETGSARLTAR